ncbi:MAG: hypothetical protein HY919_07845 [Elusimicrobia bacterium]|nr:hypothetical protein [Elusimicrobiota bacterium]
MINKDNFYKSFMFFLLSAIMGWISVIIPPLIVSGMKHYESPILIFSLNRTGIENFSIITVCFLIISEMLICFLCPQKSIVIAGLSTMSFFPIFTIIEGSIFPGTHNLLPFELLFYLIATLPGMIGAVLGNFLYKKFSAKNNGLH